MAKLRPVFAAKLTLAAIVLASAAIGKATANLPPAVATPAADAIPGDVISGLRRARADVRRIGNSVWPEFASAPFGFLFVSAGHETLLCDPRLPDGFERQADEPGLACSRAHGGSTWRSPSLLAAMVAFGPPSVIVMGTPATTSRTWEDWTLTIFHEHFHQWQAAQLGYYDKVDDLGLANGDETGMWMINYAFPYDDPAVAAAHAFASRSLAAALAARSRRDRAKTLAEYLAARSRFQNAVTPEQWRYFEFQLWQEGVARWTEFTIGMRSGDKQVARAARAMRNTTLAALNAPDLARDERIAVYPFGAGEAILLGRINPRWKNCYNQRLALGPLLATYC